MPAGDLRLHDLVRRLRRHQRKCVQQAEARKQQAIYKGIEKANEAADSGLDPSTKKKAKEDKESQDRNALKGGKDEKDDSDQ